MAASQPSRADSMVATSPRPPWTSCTPSASRSCAFSSERTSATTWSPRSWSSSASAPPMNPVAPVRKTFIPERAYPSAVFHANDEAEARPGLVDRADLVVHQAERQRDVADDVLGHVGLHVR